jgi:ElaB/YqjD/DUF883 family membrane-anchored ribosome-binding protein
MLIKVLAKLEDMYIKGAIIKKEYKDLKEKYNKKLESSVSDLKKFLKDHKDESKDLIRRAINLHSL